MVVKRENYITVQGWMVADLKLKGNAILIYAIIYGFTQDEGQWFTGSRQYLADWTNSTKQGVTKTLSRLVDEGLLLKREHFQNGVKFVDYRATKFAGGGQQSLPGVDNKVDQGGQQSCPHNIEHSSNNNLSNKDREGTKRKRFTPPTLEEVEKYCSERKNSINPSKFMSYYESNGWRVGKNPMKDWKATVRSWEQRENDYRPKNGKVDTSEDWSDDLDGYI